MNEEIKNKLVALEANMDAVLFRRGYEDEDEGMGVGGAMKAGAGLAAVGAGAYGAKVADNAIMSRYGWPNRDVPSAMRSQMPPGSGRRGAYGRAMDDAWSATKNKFQGVGASAQTAGSEALAAGKNAFYANASKGGGMLRGLWGGIRKGIRVASGGRIRFSTKDRLVALEAELDRVLFSEQAKEKRPSYLGGAAGGAVKGATAAGALGALGAGGLAAWSIRSGGLRSAAAQSLLRNLRRAGAQKDGLRRVVPVALPAAAAGVFGAKAAKYGALGGMGVGIANTRRKREQG